MSVILASHSTHPVPSLEAQSTAGIGWLVQLAAPSLAETEESTPLRVGENPSPQCAVRATYSEIPCLEGHLLPAPSETCIMTPHFPRPPPTRPGRRHEAAMTLRRVRMSELTELSM